MTGTLRVGIAGLGTFGGGVLRLLEEHRKDLSLRLGREIAVTAVTTRDRRGTECEPRAGTPRPMK